MSRANLTMLLIHCFPKSCKPTQWRLSVLLFMLCGAFAGTAAEMNFPNTHDQFDVLVPLALSAITSFDSAQVQPFAATAANLASGPFEAVPKLRRHTQSSNANEPCDPEILNVRKLRALESQSMLLRKPETDPNVYRHITLPNELDVLLISNPMKKQAAVAMNVKIGNKSDPANCRGLANVVAASMFPEETAVSSENSGTIRKFFTKFMGLASCTHTEYCFTGVSQGLEEYLKKFAQPFKSVSNIKLPDTARASPTEYRYGLGYDKIKSAETFRLDSGPLQPVHLFTLSGRSGSQTIDVPLDQKVLDFRVKYYSSHLMKLVIQGSQTLDELENMAREFFSDVPNNKANLADEEDVLTNKPEKGNTTGLLQNNNLRSCEIWTLPSALVASRLSRTISFMFPVEDQSPFWRHKPYEYALHILGHKRDGSLCSVLQRENLIVDLSVGLTANRVGFHLFQVTVVPTDKGMTDEGTRRIGALLFTMIRFCKLHPVEKWLYDQSAEMADKSFRFRRPPKDLENVLEIAENLHYYPKSECLAGPHLLYEFRPETSTAFLQALNVDNLILVIQSENRRPFCTATLRPDLPYVKKELRESFRNAWTGNATNSEEVETAVDESLENDRDATQEDSKNILAQRITDETGISYPRKNKFHQVNARPSDVASSDETNYQWLQSTKVQRAQKEEKAANKAKTDEQLFVSENQTSQMRPLTSWPTGFGAQNVNAPGTVLPRLLYIPPCHQAYGKIKLFLKQADIPETSFRFRIYLPCEENTLEGSVATMLYANIITSSLSDTLNEASEAHAETSFSGATAFSNTFGLKINGYPETVRHILHDICSAISHVKLTEEIFLAASHRQQLLLSLKITQSNPLTEVFEHLTDLVDSSHYTLEQRAEYLASLTFPGFLAELSRLAQRYIPPFGEDSNSFETASFNLFRDAFVEGGIEGNLSDEQALEFARILSESLGIQGRISDEKSASPRVVHVTNFENPTFFQAPSCEPHSADTGSAMVSPWRYRYHAPSKSSNGNVSLLFIHFGDAGCQNIAMMQFMFAWLERAFLASFQASEECSIVCILPVKIKNVVGMGLALASSLPAAVLSDKILAFFQGAFRSVLGSLTTDLSSPHLETLLDTNQNPFTEEDFDRCVQRSITILQNGPLSIPSSDPKFAWRHFHAQDAVSLFLSNMKFPDFAAFVRSLLERPWILIELQDPDEAVTDETTQDEEELAKLQLRKTTNGTSDDTSKGNKASDISWVEIVDSEMFKNEAGIDEGFPKPNSVFCVAEWDEERITGI